MTHRPYRPRVLRAPDPRPVVVITARQAQCLDALCDGLSSAQIGGLLGIDERTVKNHLTRLYRALGANDRAHAVGLVLTGRVTVLVNDPAGVRAA